MVDDPDLANAVVEGIDSRHSSNRRPIKAFVWQWALASAVVIVIFVPLSISFFYLISPREFGESLISFDIVPEVMSYLLIMGFFILSVWSLAWLLNKMKPGFWLNLIPISLDTTPTSSLGLIGERISLRGTLNSKELPELDKLIVIASIDDRVYRLRTRNSMILGTISLSLLAAIMVVIYAGQLTSYDVSAVSDTDKLKTELQGANTDLGTLARYKASLQFQSKPTSVDDSSNKSESYSDFQKSFDRNALRTAGIGVPADITSADAMETLQRQWIDQIKKLYVDSWQKDIDADKNDRGAKQWRYLITTAITRIGVILIIVFLVQILLGMYRYNTRLMTWYSSIRDVLTLSEWKRESVEILQKLLAVPNIEFGKEPRHPLEDIFRAAGNYFKTTAHEHPKAEK